MDYIEAVSYTHLDVYKRQVLIDFANQFFQFSGSLLGSSQTPALFRYIGTLLSNLRLLNSVNKFRPVISRIFSDSPEPVSYTHLA